MHFPLGIVIDAISSDFINLERSMSLWASAPGTNEGYEQHVQEAEQLFNQFFTARFYFVRIQRKKHPFTAHFFSGQHSKFT